MTQKNVEQFLLECIEYLGVGFHPDTDFADYIDIRSKEPMYTLEEAEKQNKLMEEAFDFCNANGLDIYELALNNL